MRWVLVFLFLYLIPLVMLFRNYSNFKRSCIYSSIYVVLVTSIVTTNIYMSGLNKIKEAMYYQNYLNDGKYDDRYASNFDKNVNEEYSNNNKDKDVASIKEDQSKENSKDIKKEQSQLNEDNKEKQSQEMKPIEEIQSKEKTDKDIIFNFKKQIYDIETIALIPMRDCMPYTKNIAENIKNLSNIKEDLEYAQKQCSEVIKTYEKLEVPILSKEEYTTVLENAKNDVQKAYELREKAMEYSVKLVDTKNPKYVGKITEYLKLSDNQIASFKDRISDLNKKIEE
ncbi:hypothetical protein [Romboutsia lituseburensis]|uniref:hypothetical protein n=1 Tax=Romboutsia lituseburensis TaxID=1537 RepID=UPI00215B1BFB|nr:hypothetical protein [Romboutsia lituseburensis]MCR8745626.1 hypothetical protein [Romboutsia lituseburensis]